MTDGGRDMTDGGRDITDRGWDMTDGGRDMTDGGRNMTDGGHRAERVAASAEQAEFARCLTLMALTRKCVCSARPSVDTLLLLLLAPIPLLQLPGVIGYRCET